MAFPSSPSNNQAATVNNISYVYNSTKAAWIRSALTPGNAIVNALSVTSTTSSISTTSGALIVTGGAGISGNVYVGGILNATSVSVSGTITTGNITTALVTATILSGTSIVGTLLTNAQPNINSVGTLANLQAISLGVGTTASGTLGEIRATNNITSYYSDENLKTKLGTIENALDKVDQLTGFYYEANEAAQALGYSRQREVGVSAQVTQTVLPEIVKPAPIDAQYLTVQYERFAPLLIEAIKELRQEVNAIKRQLGN